MQKVISTDKAPSAIGPYSQAIEVNGMVYTSGVIPVIPATGEIVEGGVEAQANQAFQNLSNLVEASGSKAGFSAATAANDGIGFSGYGRELQ